MSTPADANVEKLRKNIPNGLPKDGMKGLFAGTVSNGTTTIDLYANAAGTIDHLKTQTSAGSATVKLKINGTDVTGSSHSAGTSVGTGTCTADNEVAVGDKIEIVVSSVAGGCADLAWSVQFTPTVP